MRHNFTHHIRPAQTAENVLNYTAHHITYEATPAYMLGTRVRTATWELLPATHIAAALGVGN
jgi:hypothetical protein